ncbi:MAG: hypothetical protein IT338_17640 [Thermomicrobiales bacterium]|nr:hypothetical protein [Thermomicrobiales bacterium]
MKPLRLRVFAIRVSDYYGEERLIADLVVEESDGMTTIRRETDSPIKADTSIKIRRNGEDLTITVEQDR